MTFGLCVLWDVLYIMVLCCVLYKGVAKLIEPFLLCLSSNVKILVSFFHRFVWLVGKIYGSFYNRHFCYSFCILIQVFKFI